MGYDQLNVKIAIDGSQLTAGMNEATSTVEAASAQMEGSFERANFSATEARHAFHGLGEEIGVHVPRFVQTFVAHLGGVGPILAAAFTPIAVVGLLEVLEKIPDAIQKGIDKMVGFGEEAKKQYGDAVKANIEVQKENLKLAESMRQVALIGKEGPEKAALALQLHRKSTEDAAAFARRLQLAIDDTTASINRQVSGLEALMIAINNPILGKQALQQWMSQTVSVDELKKHLNDLQGALAEVEKELRRAPVEQQKLLAETAHKTAEFIRLQQERAEELARAFERSALAQEQIAIGAARLAEEKQAFGTSQELKQSEDKLRAMETVDAADERFHQKAIERANDPKLYQAEIRAITARLDYEREYAPKAYAEDTALLSAYLERLKALNTKAAREMEKPWQQLGRLLTSAFQGLVSGVETFGQAFRHVIDSILSKFLQAMAQMAVQWIATHVLMLAVKKSIHQQEVLHDAKSAAAAAWKAVAGIPVIGPILAPIAAATAFAGVEAFSARGGMEMVPSDNTLAFLHAREMVLPAHIADAVRSGAGGSGYTPQVNFHIHAIDARGVEDVLRNQQDTIVAVIRQAHREGRFSEMSRR